MNNASANAFAIPHLFGPNGEPLCEGAPGLTKREYFSARAMQGLCSSVAYDALSFEETAALAVKQADALLAELAKRSVG